MVWSKNKKNGFTPAYPRFAIQKWGPMGYTLHGHVFMMDRRLVPVDMQTACLVFNDIMVDN